MIALNNNCKYSGVKVTPANWKSLKSTKQEWRVYYRFYDPLYPEESGKQIPHKGVNQYKDLAQRKNYTQGLIDAITYDIEYNDFNPITGYRKPVIALDKAIAGLEPTTPLIQALETSLSLMKCEPDTLKDLRSVLRYFKAATIRMGCDMMPVKDIRRKHIRVILADIGEAKKDKWTPNNFNYYRAHLSMMFAELMECEAIDTNPIVGIRKMKVIRRKRATLTTEQRTEIDSKLKEDNYRFWRLMHIFFHSGAREKEIVNVRKKDINLSRQEVTYTIKKGRATRLEVRPIKDSVLHLWKEVYNEAEPEQFVFSRGLHPGDTAIRAEQITRRWKVWVKDKYNITADFYSLKHSNTDEMDELYGSKVAAALNAHDEGMVISHYAVNHKSRVNEVIRKAENKFVA